VKDKPVKLRAYMRRRHLIDPQPDNVLQGLAPCAQAIERLEPMEDSLVADLFDILAQRSPADFAFECGRRAKIGDLGVLGYRLLFCRDMRAVFDSWARYSSGSHPPFSTIFEERGGQWYFIQRPRLHFSETAMRFCAEAALTSFVRLNGQMIDSDLGIRRLELPYARPANWRDYEELGFGEVRFGASDFAIIGNSGALDQELGLNDPETCQMLAPQLEAMATMAVEESSWSDRVFALFQIRSRPPTKDEVATHFGVSGRTLHRELIREGTSYRELLHRHRCQEADRLRANTTLAPKELSWRLGFLDVGSYRRWERQQND